MYVVLSIPGTHGQCLAGAANLSFSLVTTTVSNEAEFEGDAMIGDAEFESTTAFDAIGLAMCNKSASAFLQDSQTSQETLICTVSQPSRVELT